MWSGNWSVRQTNCLTGISSLPCAFITVCDCDIRPVVITATFTAMVCSHILSVAYNANVSLYTTFLPMSETTGKVLIELQNVKQLNWVTGLNFPVMLSLALVLGFRLSLRTKFSPWSCPWP